MPKRGENIYKRKDGRWEGRYIKKRDVSGKAIYGYLYGRTYREVKEKIKQTTINNYVSSSDKKVTFSTITALWLNNVSLRVKESTIARYRTILNKHILPMFGEKLFSDIHTEIAQFFISELIKSGLATKSVNDIFTVFKNVVKFAGANNIFCPCNFSVISVKTSKTENKVISIKDQQILTQYLFSDTNEKKAGVILSLYMGLRVGEICALKWSDFDFIDNTVFISKTMLRIKDFSNTDNKTKILISSPKSDESIRVVPIPSFLLPMLMKIRTNDDAFVLSGSSKRYIEPRNMQYFFKKVLSDCGLEQINFHALRHTFATRCVEENIDIKSLSEMLGHSSIKITLDRYVHPSMNLKREGIEKLSSFAV